MTSFLIDSNVASETVKPLGDSNVLRFLVDYQEDIWLSTVVMLELRYGVLRMPVGKRRDRMAALYERFFAQFRSAGRILDFDQGSAEWTAQFKVVAERAGRNIRWADPMIAGTAHAHGLTIATRNVDDFELLDVDVVNPWEPS